MRKGFGSGGEQVALDSYLLRPLRGGNITPAVGKFLFFSAIIWAGVFLGLALRHGMRQGRALSAAGFMLKVNHLAFSTYILFVSAWSLDFHSLGREGVLMPIIGTVASTVCLWVGNAWAKRLRLATPQRAAFVSTGCVSNVGATYGIPACFLLFGIQGQALAGAYMLYHSFYVFGVLATVVAMMKAADAGRRPTLGHMVREFFSDVNRVAPLASYVAGFVCQAIWGTKGTPDFVLAVNKVWLYGSLFTAFLAVGMLLDVHSFKRHLKLLGALSVLKFVLSPIVATALAWALGMRDVALFVAAFEGAAPVAVMSVILMSLYDMDSEFASLSLIVTTVAANALLGILLVGMHVF